MTPQLQATRQTVLEAIKGGDLSPPLFNERPIVKT